MYGLTLLVSAGCFLGVIAAIQGGKPLLAIPAALGCVIFFFVGVGEDD